MKRFSLSLILLGVLCSVLLSSCSLLPPKEHTVTVTSYIHHQDVSDPSFSLSSEALSSTSSLVDSCCVILRSRTVCEDILTRSGCDYTYEELRSMLSMRAVDDTAITEITVTAPNKRDAILMAKALITVFPAHVSNIIEGTTIEIVSVKGME